MEQIGDIVLQRTLTDTLIYQFNRRNGDKCLFRDMLG
jgi:hypothetical protein